jgi:EAL domain-containing protein (putative c-di-GMP-specific phosphodiesterase class I)
MGYFSDSSRVSRHEVTQRINLHLLRCAALLAYDQPEKGLYDAEAARSTAEDEAVYYLQCKSQLYRGLCLRKLARWEEASAAFTRAANIRGWATRVEELKREAENMIAEQRMGRSRRIASGRQ